MTKIILFLILIRPIRCERKGHFAVQNCFGETAERTIEFEENQTEILSKIKKEPNQTSFGEIETGSAIKKMIIVRAKKTKNINGGDEILSIMDTAM